MKTDFKLNGYKSYLCHFFIILVWIFWFCWVCVLFRADLHTKKKKKTWLHRLMVTTLKQQPAFKIYTTTGCHFSNAFGHIKKKVLMVLHMHCYDPNHNNRGRLKMVHQSLISWLSMCDSASQSDIYPPWLYLVEHYDELYCFSYKPNVDAKERRHEWDFLDLKAEYTRMGIPNSLWKLSLVNQHYKVRALSLRTSFIL